MYASFYRLLSHALLALPLVSLALFFGVFVAVAIVAWNLPTPQAKRLAALPLDTDSEERSSGYGRHDT